MMDSKVAKVNGRSYRMLNDFVLVHDGPIELESSGGIIYPSQYVEGISGNMWRRGKVLAVGPGRRKKTGDRIPVDDIEVGDTVVYPRTVGSRLEKLDGIDQWIRVLDPKQIFMNEGK